MWFGFRSGSLSCMEGKKFSRKKLENIGDCQLYDFTAYKISNMIYDLLDNWDDHPDLDTLSLILSMYMSGDVDIIWKEGYPMPHLKLLDEENFGELELDVEY